MAAERYVEDGTTFIRTLPKGTRVAFESRKSGRLEGDIVGTAVASMNSGPAYYVKVETADGPREYRVGVDDVEPLAVDQLPTQS